MKLYPVINGKWEVKPEIPVRVTDPGYDSGTWCTLDVNVKPGTYTVVSFRGRMQYSHDGQRYSDTRTWVLGIYKDGKIPPASAWENPEILGRIGVDAGLAGFFQNKPDMEDDSWFEYCGAFDKKSYRIDDFGVASLSGLGDGSYDVWAYRDENHDIVGLEIHF